MKNTTELDSANPQYLNEICGMDSQDPTGTYNVAGLPSDPGEVGGLAPIVKPRMPKDGSLGFGDKGDDREKLDPCIDGFAFLPID